MEKLTSRSSRMYKHIKKLGKSKSYRDEHKLFLCDGEKLLDEALDSNAQIEVIITSKKIQSTVPSNIQVYLADDDLLNSLSPLKSSPGILFVCKFPQICDFTAGSGTHILLDSVQDPGNVGTIIRSAYSFGLGSIITNEGSADIYNPKTIRASMGAIFKQPIYHIDTINLTKLKLCGTKIIGTSNDKNCTDIVNADLSNSVIILGNEGQGVSKELLALCDEMITIPLSSSFDSLNVAIAASIIMWEAVKR